MLFASTTFRIAQEHLGRADHVTVERVVYVQDAGPETGSVTIEQKEGHTMPECIIAGQASKVLLGGEADGAQNSGSVGRRSRFVPSRRRVHGVLFCLVAALNLLFASTTFKIAQEHLGRADHVTVERVVYVQDAGPETGSVTSSLLAAEQFPLELVGGIGGQN